MKYENLEKDEKKIEKIEKFFADQIYYSDCYKKRRHDQIINAKTKARKEKRKEQKREKSIQQAKDKISISLIKELVSAEDEIMK